jgi:hypothetical protein
MRQELSRIVSTEEKFFMTCYKCGLELAPFETACPRCAKQKSTVTGTSVLPDYSDSRTQHLVQLEQCRHCRMLLFPADTHCPSCGAAVSRPHKITNNRRTAGTQETRKWVAVGVAVSVFMLVAFIFVWRYI